MKLHWLERIEEGLVGFILAAMTIVTFAQVVARYVFNYSFVWALELVTYLFAWLIFLGMAYGVRVSSHIGVDALVRRLGPRMTRIVGAAAAALCVVYSVILLYASWQYVAKIHSIGILAQDLPIEQWIPRTVLLLGFAILIVRFAQLFWNIASGRERGMHLADEAADALKLQRSIEDEPGARP
ncbi:C4-dicarboxylate TRAP transporter small permease protein DctQ [Burkholderiales bacterium]|nr:C4-dicarboxylate TRAP transporter small permease protein DctQ [Burkholderiales bacterium]